MARGKSGPGCLGTLILIGLVVFFGLRFAKPWYRYAQFRDDMSENARFATTLPDSMIRMRLIADADTLRLPAAARKISIRRMAGRPPTIIISSDYFERVDVPLFGLKMLHFAPKAEEPL